MVLNGVRSACRVAAVVLAFAGAGIAGAPHALRAAEPLVAKLEPAYPDYPFFGPERAKGAVIWSHGRSVTSEDSLSPTPDYVAILRAAGWDAYRFNRMRDGDTLQASSKALADQVSQLKARGYRRVVLAGQSFGAFLSLIAADENQDVHAVIATAPAAYGSFSEFYDTWQQNATRLYPLLEKIRAARVMLFFFHGDDFDPGGRGARSEEILAAHSVDHLVIDQPANLTSHWAASSSLFVRRFGGCIRDFIDGPAANSASCEEDGEQSPSAEIVALEKPILGAAGGQNAAMQTSP
jgi:dienelactone hydrolase